MCSKNRVSEAGFIPLRPLPKGGTIGVFGPSSPVEAEKLERGIRYLESLGYRIETTPSCYASMAYLAGTGRERAADLMSLVSRPDIDAIFCTRGGFGALMMLPHLNYAEIRRQRKILLGFSDVTALHWGIYARCGLPGISAGMVGTDLSYMERNPEFEASFWALLESGHIKITFPGPDRPSPTVREAHGTAMPGTMSVAAMLLGSRYFPDLRGCIPILEDVNEQRHKLEAYLQQLRLGGHFDAIEAVILGYFSPAPQEEYPERPSLNEVFGRAFGGLPQHVEVLKGLSYGHIPNKISLPAGVPISVSWKEHAVLKTRHCIFES
ncbi:MAG: S66 peptidase family protein [Cyclonatronaceae bacterium]